MICSYQWIVNEGLLQVGGGCNYFQWLDPEWIGYAFKVIHKLQKRVDRLEFNKEVLGLEKDKVEK